MAADYYRYLAEFRQGASKEEAQAATKAYGQAQAEAERLGLRKCWIPLATRGYLTQEELAGDSSYLTRPLVCGSVQLRC